MAAAVAAACYQRAFPSLTSRGEAKRTRGSEMHGALQGIAEKGMECTGSRDINFTSYLSKSLVMMVRVILCKCSERSELTDGGANSGLRIAVVIE